ncbi:MAG: amphi-Trp domain-containing protein [Methylotenera sp.]
MEQQQFKHESLQDKKSIQNMLKSISKAIAKGELKFSDQDGEIVMEPKGLLNLKITARKQDGEQRLDVRMSWKTQEKTIKKAPLSIE